MQNAGFGIRNGAGPACLGLAQQAAAAQSLDQKSAFEAQSERQNEALKANYTEPISDDDSRMRGMPNLGLTTQEIDDLVALLESTGPHPSEFSSATGIDLIAESGVE